MMNNSKVWTGREAKTPFAPVFRMPYYIAKHGTEDFKKRLVDYCLQCEKILSTEELVSGVVKNTCLLYTSPSPRDLSTSRMPSSA